MVLTIDIGWAILPIEGNPYPTAALCQAAKGMVLKERKRVAEMVKLQFSKVECLEREVWKL